MSVVLGVVDGETPLEFDYRLLAVMPDLPTAPGTEGAQIEARRRQFDLLCIRCGEWAKMCLVASTTLYGHRWVDMCPICYTWRLSSC